MRSKNVLDVRNDLGVINEKKENKRSDRTTRTGRTLKLFSLLIERLELLFLLSTYRLLDCGAQSCNIWSC